MTSFDSATLYRDCHSGEMDAQQAAYRTLWGYLLRVVYQLVRNQPDADDLAQDCAQQALVRIHQRLIECQEPAAFRTWARRIASNLTIDELRRRRRLTSLPTGDSEPLSIVAQNSLVPSPGETVLAELSQQELRALLNQAPISDRSRRTVIGRFLDDTPDETLAQTESELAATPVLPSHIQVTRAKNLAKLRDWQPLHHFLQQSL